MDSVNKVILVGRAGRDPDIGTTADGQRIARLSLATYRRDGSESRTDWHALMLRGDFVEIAERYIRRGDRLYVEGCLDYGVFEKDGVAFPITEIQVQELTLLERMK